MTVAPSASDRPGDDPRAALGRRVQSLRLPERSAGGSNLAWLVCYVSLAVALWLGYRQVFVVPKQLADAKKQSARPLPTKRSSSAASTTTPNAAPLIEGEIALESKGYIVPAHQILVSPKVSGMVIKLSLEEGARVKKDEVLARIESTEYQADFDRATANVALAKQKLAELENGSRPEEIAQAEAELAEVSANLRKAEADWKRAKELRVGNIIPPQDYDLAESQHQALIRRSEKVKNGLQLLQIGPREERKAMARAELRQAEADLAKAEWRLGNCTIKAPISGTILKKNAEEGNIVNAAAFNGSFSLCEMADLSDLEIDLSIQERDISRVKQGQKCRVRSEAYPDRTYEGVVDRLMPIADRAKGAIPVRVKVRVPADEEGIFLKPEMGAIVSFLSGAVAPTAPVSERLPAAADRTAEDPPPQTPPASDSARETSAAATRAG